MLSNNHPSTLTTWILGDAEEDVDIGFDNDCPHSHAKLNLVFSRHIVAGNHALLDENFKGFT